MAAPFNFAVSTSRNTELLRLLDLPVFSTVEEFAAVIHLPVSTLATLIRRANSHYKRYFLRKRNGHRRLIAQPAPQLKALQAWILRRILDKLIASPHATAYVVGRSLVHNTQPHEANRYFVCIDLEDFFPSITVRSLNELFERIGYSTEAAALLASICAFRGRLPQGAVTSPALSNLTSLELDRKLSEIAASRKIVYTRYADDLTFSANDPKALRGIVELSHAVVRTHGFRINYGKLKLLGPSKRCRITGLTKNSSEPKFSVGTAKKRNMRAVMHHIANSMPVTGPYTTIASVDGWLAFLRGHDLPSYTVLRNYWERARIKGLLKKLTGAFPTPPPSAAMSPSDPLGLLGDIGGSPAQARRIDIAINSVAWPDGKVATGMTYRLPDTVESALFSDPPSFRITFGDGTRIECSLADILVAVPFSILQMALERQIDVNQKRPGSSSDLSV